MRVCACVRARMRACMCVCMHGHVCVRVHAWACVCVCECSVEKEGCFRSQFYVYHVTNKSPLPLSTHRVAQNMLRSDVALGNNDLAMIRLLLENCIKLLGEDDRSKVRLINTSRVRVARLAGFIVTYRFSCLFVRPRYTTV